MATAVVVGERYCNALSERQLTVRKTSLFYPGDGFTVYESHLCSSATTDRASGGEPEEVGELIFRVDTYGGSDHLHRRRVADDVVLMGPQGECILTVRRKRPSLHQRWEGFLGGDDQESRHAPPLFSVRRSSIISRFGTSGGAFLVQVYRPQRQHLGKHDDDDDDEVGQGRRHPVSMEYHVDGSFPRRCCTVYEGGDGNGCNGNGSSKAVAEITRKVDASTNVLLGKDVFYLRLAPGFDAAFAMGLILALDQITGDVDIDGNGPETGAADGTGGSPVP